MKGILLESAAQNSMFPECNDTALLLLGGVDTSAAAAAELLQQAGQ